MATADQYAEWIVNNANKRGTPEFDTVAQAYQLAKQEEARAITPVVQPSKERTTGEAFSDIGAQLKKGAAQLVQFPGQLYGLTTGDFSETGLYGYGKEMEAAAEAAKSPGLKAREAARAAAVAEAEKKGQLSAAKTAIGETITDPALALGLLAENLPSMLLPAGAAVGVGRAALQKGLAKGVEAAAAREAAIQAGSRAAIGAGAVQQGADVGTGSYEQVYKRLVSQGVSEPEAAAQAINLARAAGVSGAIISILAQRLPGASKLEEVLAGKTTTAGLGRAVLGGALREPIGEIPEEVGGRFTQNLALRTVDPTQSLTAGLGEAGGMAALAGAGLGGIGGGISAVRGKRALAEEEARKPQEAVEPQPAIAEAPKPFTAEEQRELKLQQQAALPPEPTAEAMLGEVRGKIQTAPPTTPADVARIRDDHETAVINALLEQDRKMQSVSDLARLNLERMSQTESLEAATKDADRRVREGRLMARVQSLIDENIPFASTAIADINRKFEMIGESPLDAAERARVQNIMTMAQGFTDFVKLPSLPVREQDRFAENQAMEALIKERKPRGQVSPQPVRAETPAPSPVVGETPVSGRVEEGAAIRPTVSPEPGITEDRQRAEPVEPQKAEAAAPKPVTGEAGIVRPEEEVAVPEPVVAEAAKPEVEAGLVATQPPTVETPMAESTTLTIQRGGSDTTLNLGKPVWQATDDDLVKAVQDSGTYLGKPGSKYDPYMAWREAHSEAIQKAKREGKTFPPEVLYDKPTLIRDDLSDSQADEAIDAMVDVYRATKDYGKAVEAYRNFGKKLAAEAPVAPKPSVAEGEGRAVGSDEEVKKSPRATPAQQVSDFEQTLRTALNKFGLKDVGLKLIDGMTEEGSYAQQLIRIAADSANPIRTLRHEAIHALRELGFFTPQQWQSLSKMAKDKWIDQYLKQRNVDGKPLKAGEESRYDAYMREYEGDMEKITEEAVADAFADFDATKPPAGLMQALLTRLRNLFQAIKSALTKVESPEQIFGKVERGELAAGAPEQGKEAKSLRDRGASEISLISDKYKMAGAIVDGREVRDDVPNMSSISASLDDYTILNGVREVPMSDFTLTGKSYSVSGTKRIENLAERIKESGEINPLIVVVDSEGAYVLEGSHRAEALFRLGAKSFPAVVVLDNESLSNADIRKSLRKSGEPAPTTAGQSALDTINQLGMGVKEPEKGTLEKAKAKLQQIGEAPAKDTIKDWKKKVADLMSYVDGKLFSADAPFENKLREGYRRDMKDMKEFIGAQLAISQSQAVHADAVSTRSMLIGKPRYRKDLLKWEAVEDPANEIAKAKILDKIAEKYGLTKEEAVQVAHTYMSAANYEGILERNAANKESKDKVREKARKLDSEIVKLNAEYQKRMDEQREQAETEIAKLQGKIRELKSEGDRESEIADLKDRIGELRKEREPGKLITQLKKEIKALREEHAEQTKEIERLGAADVFVTPEQAAMVQPGLEIANQIPEVKEITALWNQQRENIKNVLVETGLWTPKYADAMMDNAAYVPFNREMEEDSDDSPEIMIRGLQVKAKEHKLKGSSKPVANVFENMARWQQYAINRAIRNHKALQMVDAATEMPFGDGMVATKVSEAKRGKNITRVWRDGKQEFYEMADPMLVDAFKNLGAVSIPSIKYFTAIANKLRQFIVLYPMFSVAQLSQDSVVAMFSSGLQPRFALKIPYLAVKHAISTFRGTNNLHNELINFGVVGVRDFNAAVSRDDAAITAGIKMPPGGVQKVKYVLERIAMSADNAVRQAVYEAAMQQPGVTQAEALEKAFEVINFRRRGSSKLVNLIGQTVPFFYAYLSAQRVAYKTITGVGISPVERKAAIETLIYTSAAVMALSFMYAMANGDDEAYKETPGNIRDRSINIPGTNGFRIPLRPDFFLFPKIIAEHTYHLIAENGFSDPAKFKKAMADNFFNATLSPNVVPQAFKPVVEIVLNYDFFSGKSIVGFFEQNKEAGRQFNDSTSEFAKMMGGAGLSPQKVDHFIRGYFGTVGGLFLYGTNFFIEGESGVPRPELSFEDAIKTFPGVSAFKQKPTENALKVDFYELRDAIEKAKNTYDDIKKRSPEGLQDFIENEENYAKLALEKSVTKIADHLSDIRRTIQQVSAAPEDRFSAAEKQERIKELKEVELQLLKSVNLKEMRAMAKM